MNYRFWPGFVAGVMITAALNPMRNSPPSPPAPLASVKPETAVDAEQRATLESRLAQAREQVSAQATIAEDLKGEIARLEAGLKDVGSEDLRPSEPVAKKAEKPDTAEARANLRVKLQSGRGLPPEVADWLELNDGQRKLVGDRLKAEGAEFYAVLRRLASEDPSVPLPSADGPGLLMALCASPGYYQDEIKVEKARAADPDKPLYIEEVLDPTSRYFRMIDASLQIRARTLEDLAPILSEEQRQKLAGLMGRSWYNLDGVCLRFDRDILLRRPR